jgi:hypothetical protein
MNIEGMLLLRGVPDISLHIASRYNFRQPIYGEDLSEEKHLTKVIFALLILALFESTNGVRFGSSSDALASSELSASQPSCSAPTNWTPVIAELNGPVQPIADSNGQYSLVYDLLMTDFHRFPAQLERLDLIADGAGTIKSFDREALKKIFISVSGAKKSLPDLGAGSVGIVFVNIGFKDLMSIPKAFYHTLTFKTKDNSGIDQSYSYRVAETKVDFSEPVCVSPPLKGNGWVAIGGYTVDFGHRHALFAVDGSYYSAQRYAIDWVRVDDDRFSVHGDVSKCANSACYDQPVYAVADGTISGVIDQFDNQVPLKAKGPERLSFPAGNSVTLAFGEGRYATYAHLKRHSIVVKQGQKVRRGDVIGHVGNSGNTSGPHLHMHITDRPSILGSHGVPYVFDQFQLTGRLHDTDEFFKNDAIGKRQAIDPAPNAGLRQKRLPASGDVVSFRD